MTWETEIRKVQEAAEIGSLANNAGWLSVWAASRISCYHLSAGALAQDVLAKLETLVSKP